jgi:putrescine aminotransferase
MTESPSMVRHVALRAYGALRFMNAVQGSMEDIEGAISQEQFGVIVLHARYVVMSCLWVRSLTLEGEIEYDADSVSFDFFAGLPPDEIAQGLAIVNDSIQIETGTAAAWFDGLRDYVDQTERLLGYEAPLAVLRSPDGPMGLVRIARQWSPVIDELGLPPLLPSEWLPSAPKSSGSAAPRPNVVDLYRRHLSVALARLAELMHAGVESRSEGAYVWDEAGRKYLDCGGYGVFLLGHCHPKVVGAVVEQVRTHPASSHVLLNRAEGEAAATLARVAPPGLDQIYFALSGSEAVEAALKLARLNGKRRVIAMENGYHGMTLGALSATGRESYRTPFEPLLEGVVFVPFGDADALGHALGEGPEACVLLEPVQAEGGVVIPPDGYLRDVQSACRARGALLVVDEIQTGLGRLGTWWGVDRERVAPDILLVGKALSGGVVPVSAAVGSESVFRRLSREPLLHTSTFSGAPIAMAAVKASIETIEAENIVPRAAELGNRLRVMVTRTLAEACPALVREVRCIGLLVAIEWETDYLALDFLIEMLDRLVILSHSMNAPRVTRLTPPAILSEADVVTLESALFASSRALANR